MAEHCLHHSILEFRETKDSRSLEKVDSKKKAMILKFTSHRSAIIGHGAKPRELLLTTISCNTELDDHKIVCECLFSVYTM